MQVLPSFSLLELLPSFPLMKFKSRFLQWGSSLAERLPTHVMSRDVGSLPWTLGFDLESYPPSLYT